MWHIKQPVEVTFGEGTIAKIGEILERIGSSRAFLVSTHSSVKNGTAQKIQDLSDGRIVGISSDVHPDASVEDVNSNTQKARELNADCIIGLGGGSAMDTAKCVAICVRQNLHAEDILFGAKSVDAVPIVMIPTTAGTGSEVTQGAGLTDKIKGIPGGIDGRFATAAIVDPELTYTMPKRVTVDSGIDALSHALDTLSRRDLNPYSQQLAIYAAREIMANLEKAALEPDNKEARHSMMEASLMAGLACSQAGLAGPHACGVMIGGMFHLPHGEAVAFTLDRWIRLNAAANPKINDYAKQIGYKDADALANAIVALKKEFNLPMTLRDLGADESAIEPLAKGAASNFFGWMEGNCAPQSFEQMKEFYRNML